MITKTEYIKAKEDAFERRKKELLTVCESYLSHGLNNISLSGCPEEYKERLYEYIKAQYPDFHVMLRYKNHPNLSTLQFS